MNKVMRVIKEKNLDIINQKMNEMTTNVDMSSFANGTYFFKLKINGVEANFKILKM
jgi:hypothetical protein